MLELMNVSKHFDGVQAVNQLSLTLQRGEILGMIGPNGAGKTTVVNLISGMDSLSAGRILLQGEDISPLAPHRKSAFGIARTFQNIRLFKEMDVLGNVMTGRHLRIPPSLRRGGWIFPWNRKRFEVHRRKSLACLGDMGIEHLADKKASTLSYGDQRRVELARAMAAEPKLLLLDEPVAGMPPRETVDLGELILSLKRRGITLMVVEHDMKLINRISDRVGVLNFGTLIALDSPDKVRNHPEVVEAYLGKQG